MASPYDAPEFKAIITFLTFFYKVVEFSGFTNFEWMSLSNLISLFKLSSNYTNLV